MYNSKVVRVLIASPSDLSDERSKVREAVDRWNGSRSEESEVTFQTSSWELNSVPRDNSAGGQAELNRQLLSRCDVVVAMFWYKVGSPTNGFDSGTIEEIELAIQMGLPVHLFFKNSPYPTTIRSSDLERLELVKAHFSKKSLYKEFFDLNELSIVVMQALEDDAQSISRSTNSLGENTTAASVFDHPVTVHSPAAHPTSPTAWQGAGSAVSALLELREDLLILILNNKLPCDLEVQSFSFGLSPDLHGGVPQFSTPPEGLHVEAGRFRQLIMTKPSYRLAAGFRCFLSAVADRGPVNEEFPMRPLVSAD